MQKSNITIKICKDATCKKNIQRELLNNLNICRSLAYPDGNDKRMRNLRYRNIKVPPRKEFVSFVKYAVKAGKEIMVARNEADNDKMVGMLIWTDHKTRTTLDGGSKPVAMRNEMYLDLVCGKKGTKAGRLLIDAFHERAENDPKIKQTRLYAAQGSDKYWSGET